MNPNIQSGILAAFAADALSLGVHWVYDTALIKDRYGRLDKIVKPEIASFHKKKRKEILPIMGIRCSFFLNHFPNAPNLV